MSGLAALLAGKIEPGMLPVARRRSRPTDVRHTVEHAGWRFAHYDGWIHDDQGRVPRARLGEALALPDDCGQDFDALAGCLRRRGRRRTARACCCCGTAGARSPVPTSERSR